MTTDEQEIRTLDDSVRKALLARDLDALERLFAGEFVVTNPFHRVLTKAQVIEAVRDGRLRHAAYEREIEYVRVDGDTAIVMGSEVVVDDGPTIHRRYTEVWLRRAERWQVVARHTHVIPEGPSLPA